MDALGDATRRAILELLLEGPSPVGRLADGLPVSRPAVSQHLRILKEAGLVSDRQVGTRRLYAVDPDGVRAVREYWESFWSQALARFQSAAADAAPTKSGTAGDKEADHGEGN
jgi:DNA-binding transcriptional ArsR family regulator